MAMGSPEVSGVMASICTLPASSLMPMISGPNSRDRIMRRHSPRARTTPFVRDNSSVCLFASVSRFIASPPLQEGMRGKRLS